MVANAISNDLVVPQPADREVKRRLPRISDPYQLGYCRTASGLSRSVCGWIGSISTDAELRAEGPYPAAKTPSHVAFARDSSVAYVTMQDSDELIAIDLATHKEVLAHEDRQDAGRHLDEPAGFAIHRHHGADTSKRLTR